MANRQYEDRYRDNDDGRNRDNDRGPVERAGDEVRSWFGDEDAERRRRMDEQRDRPQQGRGWESPSDYGRASSSRDDMNRGEMNRGYAGRSSSDRGNDRSSWNRPETNEGDYRYRGASGDRGSSAGSSSSYSGGSSSYGPSSSGGYGGSNYSGGNYGASSYSNRGRGWDERSDWGSAGSERDYRSQGGAGRGSSSAQGQYGHGGQSNWGQGSGSQYGQGSQSDYGTSYSGASSGGSSSMQGQGRQGGSSFWGRGPKGYQRNDSRVQEDVSDRLTYSEVDAENIEVSVSNGEVTLTGTVRDRSDKRRAEDIAEEVSGVREVHNNIRVQRDSGSNTSSSWEQQTRGMGESDKSSSNQPGSVLGINPTPDAHITSGTSGSGSANTMGSGANSSTKK